MDILTLTFPESLSVTNFGVSISPPLESGVSYGLFAVVFHAGSLASSLAPWRIKNTLCVSASTIAEIGMPLAS